MICDEPVKCTAITGSRRNDKPPVLAVAVLEQNRLALWITGESLAYLAVERLLLRGIEQGAHIKDVSDGRLLEISHPCVDLVDLGSDLGAVALLLAHCLGKARIGGAQCKFEFTMLYGKIPLQRTEADFLRGCKAQLLVHEVVHAAGRILLGKPAVGRECTKTAGRYRQNQQQDRVEGRDLHGAMWRSAEGARSAPSTSV